MTCCSHGKVVILPQYFLLPIQTTQLTSGNVVKIIDDIATLHNLQEGHGGWVDDMALVSCRLDSTTAIDSMMSTNFSVCFQVFIPFSAHPPPPPPPTHTPKKIMFMYTLIGLYPFLFHTHTHTHTHSHWGRWDV